ncbi:STAS domain-containing protein [Amycolatopsis australiensis]|uniref:Anti-anti-sigma factor n=1 Tax=Amycolatopsis australiensis TaxID=546364 RepID=A0A1K1SRE3_9PSEU|nr:STAS domain-containing protein [Amycolatopsis australiensis]SFW86992.1 anti-anti-sigma factor [Amycolatopsis australiensis]
MTFRHPEERPADARDELTVSVRSLDGARIVAAEGTVDLHTAGQLTDAITAALAHQPTRLVIDLTAVRFLSAAGLHVLLKADHAAGDRTQVKVVATGPALHTITLTALDRVLAVHPTLADATGH